MSVPGSTVAELYRGGAFALEADGSATVTRENSRLAIKPWVGMTVRCNCLLGGGEVTFLRSSISG